MQIIYTSCEAYLIAYKWHIKLFFLILYLQKAMNGSVFGSTMCIKESKLGKEEDKTKKLYFFSKIKSQIGLKKNTNGN